MILGYTLKLGLKVCFTNVKTQKIDSSILKIFRMVLTSFQIEDKLGLAKYFKQMFLEIVLEMFFLTFSNADMSFLVQELTQRSYTITKALLTIKKI